MGKTPEWKLRSIKKWQDKNPTKVSGYKRRWAKNNRIEAGIVSKGYKTRKRVSVKELVMAVYSGGRCACCGETEPSFLTLDHINNDGKKHRKEVGRTGAPFYSWLVKNGFPPGLQVLCANCNMSKEINKGVCAHQLSTGGKQ